MLTGRKHPIEILDRSEVHEEAPRNGAEIFHLFWGSSHNGRGSEGNCGIGGLRSNDRVGDLDRNSISFFVNHKDTTFWDLVPGERVERTS